MVPFLGTTITGTGYGSYGDFTIEDLGGDDSVVVNGDGDETHAHYVNSEDFLAVAYDGTDGDCASGFRVNFFITPTYDESLDGTSEIIGDDDCFWGIFNYCFCPPTAAPTVSAMPTVAASSSPSMATAAPTNATDGECCCDDDEASLFDTILSILY